MIIHRRLQAALAVTWALVMFASAQLAHAQGTPTYRIYVGGGMGGQVEASGLMTEWPSGACGMRVTSANVIAWYWAKGQYGITGELNIPNNGWLPLSGQLTELIEFTGPFGPHCQGPYVFHTPATPDGRVPPGAIALVVQVSDPTRVEFLDAALQPVEPSGDVWGDDPDLPDVCEMFPDLCTPSGSGVDNPCNSSTWKPICDLTTTIVHTSHGSGEILRPVLVQVTRLQGGPAAVPVLRRTLAQTHDVERLLDALDAQRQQLVGLASTRFQDHGTRRAVDSVSAGIDLARIHLRRCQSSLAESLRVMAPAARGQGLALARQQADRSCAAASQVLHETQQAAMRLLTRHIPAEARLRTGR